MASVCFLSRIRELENFCCPEGQFGLNYKELQEESVRRTDVNSQILINSKPTRG